MSTSQTLNERRQQASEGKERKTKDFHITELVGVAVKLMFNFLWKWGSS